jgi:hypothetical protein
VITAVVYNCESATETIGVKRLPGLLPDAMTANNNPGARANPIKKVAVENDTPLPQIGQPNARNNGG